MLIRTEITHGELCRLLSLDEVKIFVVHGLDAARVFLSASIRPQRGLMLVSFADNVLLLWLIRHAL